MNYGDTCVGYLTLDQRCEVLDIADAAIDEVDLPIATHLEAHCLTDDLWGGLGKDRLYGTAIRWGSIEVR